MNNFITATKPNFRKRYFGMVFSLFTMCIVPSMISGVYLFQYARDQYVSTVAFTVRSEDISSSIDILGGLSALGSGSSSDSDILYEYIQSKALVSAIDKKIDLRTIFSRFYNVDPIYSYDPNGTIEDMTDYWPNMVKVFYDKGTGLMEIQVRAFEPEDAQAIAENIYLHASDLVNRLSAIAREDAISYARDELNRSEMRLKEVRKKIMEFRSVNRLIDPLVEIEMQAGVISSLQKQLSESLIEYDLLLRTSSVDDPRSNEIQERINAVKIRIMDERSKFTSANKNQMDFPLLIGEFEGLVVDREYAEKTYLASLAQYDSAFTEARRQSKYLAAYIEPTRAEKSEYPKRYMLTVLTIFGCVIIWLTSMLTFYAVKDRR